MAEKKNYTIIDIAKMTGLSKATVGRVIGNYGSVSAAAKEKVEKAIREIDYVPNAIAQGLRSSGTRTIGVVVGSIKNNFCNRFLYAVEKTAIKNKYDVLFCNTGENIEREFQCLKNLKARRVDGIILISSVLNVADIPAKYAKLYQDIPIVMADRKIIDMDLDFITSGNCQGSYNIIKRFAELGHKHIGVIFHGEVSTIKERLRGYRQACENYNLVYNEKYMLSARTIEEMSINKIKQYLRVNPEITAVMVLNNSLLAKLLAAVREDHRRIPEDLSVVSWDDDELNELFGISTVEQQVEEIGKMSMERLLHVIDVPVDQEEATLTMTLKTGYKERGSCQKA